MAKLVLNIEYDFDFTLIGISCHEKDYRLSWTINNKLGIELSKEKDLEIDVKKHKEPMTHSFFAFEEEDQFKQFYLINNRGTKGLLIPEQKQADYFLMIKGTISPDEKSNFIKLVKEIPMVQLAFDIVPDSLKSKENLLF